ncbi:GNAT family N-acetyltransferase [Deefgea rivuli]|uniref:GNAT family N-acetyltransferase n=1 Tax=Deefgea rivuli TaxID=400948 RepID=UPI000568281A|nr:GNAT family N-acetyltransferase [Deefgea rivuli]
MKIRQAAPQDAAAIAALHAKNWQQAYHESLSAAYLRDQVPQERLALWQTRLQQPAVNQRIWLAEIDGELCGFVCAYGGQDARWGTYIDNLHVATGSRRSGVGRRLLAAVAQWHDKEYLTLGLYLWTIEINTYAINFYLACGAVAQDSDIWHAPDGSVVPVIRMAWEDGRDNLVLNHEKHEQVLT